MPDCEHHNICGLPDCDLPDDADFEMNLCILHSHNPDKNTQTFAEALDTHCKDRGGNFDWMVFPERACFLKATFTKEATFFEATFTEEANFIGATFTEEANFRGATFLKEAIFREATFTKEATFFEATFTKEADFSGATFSSKIWLSTARFSPEAILSFRDSKFQGRMNLTYGQEASQEETPDEERMIAVFTSAQQVDFRNVVIEQPDTLTFIGADFTRCQFLGTDLRKVQLDGVNWPKRGNRVVVYDEIVPLKEGETRHWDQIERLYNQLKQNYQGQQDYERAGDFHYGEKEMRRRNPKTRFGRRVLLWLYLATSGYGERIGLPLAWAGVLFAMSTCAYIWWGITPKGTKTPLALNCLWNWITVVHYSFRVMTFLRPTDFAPQGIAKLFHTIQSLLGPLFIGLSALAVRQRLKR